MVRDEREVGESDSDQHCPREIDPEDARQSAGLDIRWICFHFLWPRIGHARNHKNAQRDESGYKKHCKGELILTTKGQHSSNDQWSKQRAGLVQGLVYPEAPTVPHLPGRV